ncbi:phosphoribosylanthranilate isomerase [Rufibacter psychrotolerans]|uniref:phosphoribosylanthranilate isomerase n=1 Tax=Rufibacter psychrotolerans TaxID=2812556 RepID=UPI0019689E73|nr:phosphoribosylanthranilate isomerase [Rufibacter sp. SYSU D00308]
MPNHTLQIKVCGMKYRQNLQDLLLLQPDYVGFIFYDKSPRCIAEQEAVFDLDFPIQAQKVGVFVDEAVPVIREKASQGGLQVVQLHGHETPQTCRVLKEAGLVVMKAFRVGTDFDFAPLQAYAASVDFFLFDASGASPGGNGVRFNWELLQKYSLEVPYFLSGGIDLMHAAEIKALRLPHLYGVDLNSKFEVQPGLKDVPRLKQFVEELRG